MSQFDHDAVKGTDLSGDDEEELDELQDTEVEGAVNVADTAGEAVQGPAEQE